MAEGHVTVDRQTHDLPDPFFVVATQNPSRSAGTYPLPDSQLDRFLMRISIGNPNADVEQEIVSRGDGHRGLADLQSIGCAEDVIQLQQSARKAHVEAEIDAYIVRLSRYTRESTELRTGVSTRGAQALHRAAQARAVIHGRDYVNPDDVRQLVGPVFGHRIGIRNGGNESGAIAGVMHEMLATIGAPD